MSATSAEIARAAELMIGGGVVVFPTETVYGIGALAHDAEAVDRIFRIKGRPKSRPLIVHLARAEQMDAFARSVPDYARTLAEELWPGPLTLVLPRKDTVLDEVTGGGDTVAMRVPDHPVALALLLQLHERCGDAAGVAAPSANPFGEPPPTNMEAVVAGLGRPSVDDDSKPDMILDGGECPGVPSTIVSCVGDVPRILRYGSMSKETVEKTIGRWVDL